MNLYKWGQTSLVEVLSVAGLALCLWCICKAAYAQPSPADTLQAHRFVQRADSLRKFADYDSSSHYYNRAIPIYKKSGAWNRAADCMIGLGANHIKEGDFGKAEQAVEKAETVARRQLSEDTSYLVRIWRLRGRIDEAGSNYRSAMDWYEKALDLLDNNPPSNQRKLRATILYYIGDVYNSRGKYDSAIDQFFEALDLYNRSHDPGRLFIGKIYNSLGIAHQNLGDTDSAIEYYRRSMEIDEQELGPDHLNVAMGLNNIAIVYYYQGDYKRALDYMKKATRTMSQYLGEQHPQVAIGYNNISIVYSEMERLEEATSYMEKSLTIKKAVFGEINLDIAIGYQNLGALYFDRKKYDRAIKYYLKALELYRQIFDEPHPEMANVYANLGQVYSEKNEFTRALEYLRKDLEINSQLLGADHPFVGDTFNKIGLAHASQKDYISALQYYDKALAVLGGDFREGEDINTLSLENVSYPVFLLEALGNKGEAHRALYEQNGETEQLQRALDTCLKASSLIRKMQIEYRSHESKLLLGERAHDLYESGIETAYSLFETTGELRYIQYALYFAERSKARVLLDQLMEMNAKRFAGIPDTLIAREDTLRARITRLQARLRSRTDRSTHIDSAGIHSLRDTLFSYKQELRSHIASLEKEYPKYYQLKYEDIILRTDYIQNELLQEDQTLIEYFQGDKNLFAVVVNREHVTLHKMKADSSFLSDLNQFHKTILAENVSTFAERSKAIYNHLFRPLLPSVKGDRIVVIPDGLLDYLPFETLTSSLPADTSALNFRELPYLMRDFTVSYAPSASFLKYWNLHFTGSLAERPFLGFAPVFPRSGNGEEVPSPKQKFDRRLKPLPMSSHELEQVAALLREQNRAYELFLRSEATEHAFKRQPLEQYNIIHLASHAFAAQDSTSRPGIYFSIAPDAPEDGVLRLDEIYNLRLNADLVVLSACETGVGEMVKGEGLLSLARAFQYAGAKDLFVSLWRVDDRSTALLVERFYQSLMQGDSHAGAIRKAKMAFLDHPRYASPRFWAPFVLVGK